MWYFLLLIDYIFSVFKEQKMDLFRPESSDI